MEALLPYSIPIRGLNNGVYEYDFVVDSTFFEAFEQSPIEKGKVDVHMVLDKRPDGYSLQFSFEGTIASICDRCLASINLPVNGENVLLVKVVHEEKSDDPEVLYITPETQKINVAPYIYEFICLNIPIVKKYDCENDDPRPCDDKTLQYLKNEENEEVVGNPIWDQLKNFKSNK